MTGYNTTETMIGIASTIIMVVMFVAIFRSIMNSPEPTGDEQDGQHNDSRTEDVTGH